MELSVDIKKRLQDFNLEVSFKTKNDVVGLLGASGSGKSMTLRCIAGLETPDSGRIVLNGRVLYDSKEGINIPSRKRKVGLLFQNYALFPHMTVEENIRFGLEKYDQNERSHKVERIISMMGLTGFEKRYPNQLSGGQQQRVALARALVVEPEALFLDEPFSALDGYLRNHLINQLIDSLSEYKGVTLFVTHNMEEAYNICDELIVLSGGRKAASGEKEKIFNAPSNLAVAQLIGCKNLTEVKMVSDYMVEALQWGCKLDTVREAKDILNVGIHAHNIRLANETDDKNVFPCWPSYVREAPFHVSIYLHIGSPPHKAMDYHIQWEVSMEQWNSLKGQSSPINICLEPEKLILIDDE